MLRDFVEKKHYLFVDRVDTWQDAIKLCCKPIEKDGTVDATYADEIIECINKYGPYIVLLPNVAMPHSQEGATGVNKTTISFMKVEEPVHFDPNDQEKDAILFFTLASCNHDEHLQNMSKLSDLLINEEVVNELLKAKSPEDLLRIQEQFLD